MTTGNSDAATITEAPPALPQQTQRAIVAEPRIRKLVLMCRVLGDMGALLLGLMVAEGIQQALLALGGPVQPLRPMALFNALAILMWLALFANAGLYDSRRLINATDEFKLVLQAVAFGTVAATFVAFVLKVPSQRSWVLAVWVGSTLAVLTTRFIYRGILGSMRRAGALANRMIIVGAGREGRNLCRAVNRARSLGFQVVGFLDDALPAGQTVPGLPDVVGPTASIREAVRLHNVDAVLVAGGSVATETAERVYRDLQGLPIDFHLSTGILGVAASRVAVQRFDDVPVLGLRRAELSVWQRLLKRTFDLILSGLLLALLSPVLLACAIAVRLSSPGPILYRQPRFGQDGQVFYIHKFRSMVVDADNHQAVLRSAGNDADGPLFKLQRDPRITRVGRILRTWSLDELPQLLDVLCGHMSLVGPRPLSIHEVDLSDGWARIRQRVRPGATGLWQVSGRHRLPFDDLVRYDLYYVENWSLSMDLFILLRTIPAVLLRSGV
jgi:exopolysaccharide biosynthesis polyprenyl glycosylphosphotransferase